MPANSNAAQIGADLTAMGFRAQARAGAIVSHFGMLLVTKVQAKASGRPGPRAQTGDYRRSWTSVRSDNGGAASAMVGTNKPQGPRLEYGFVGADRLGRVYNQPPFPHLAPAVAEVEPAFVAALADVASWSGGGTIAPVPGLNRDARGRFSR